MLGMHKNAWNSKVSNDSNAFEFAVNPKWMDREFSMALMSVAA
jgi:hypothetical protein